MAGRLKLFRYTSRKPLYYWLIGAFLFWLPLPLGLADILIDPQWHAPHGQCDSLGIPIFRTRDALLPWALISFVVSAILVFPFGRGKTEGTDIFKCALGNKIWNYVVLIPIALVCAFLLFEVINHIWGVIVPQTIISDCGGRAEEITVVRRRPPIQLIPLLCLVAVLWFLHLRALILSPKKK